MYSVNMSSLIITSQSYILSKFPFISVRYDHEEKLSHGVMGTD